MAVSEELEKLHCACGALLLRVNTKGVEVYCRRCERRLLVPFEELQGKERLVRFMREWQARAKRP